MLELAQLPLCPRTMTGPILRLAVVAVVLAFAGCGTEPAAEQTSDAAPSAVPTPTVAPAPTSIPKPPPVRLGPEWTQRDGQVRIEATASGDARTALRELQALGLQEGVVFGRLVNGWLPVESFDSAQRLSSVQFVRPTGAGTG
jgi:hypothetical protein